MVSGHSTETTASPGKETIEEQPVEQGLPAEEVTKEDLELADDEGFVPRGTLLFLLVMLMGYGLYWAYLWFIVVIERGAGGIY